MHKPISEKEIEKIYLDLLEHMESSLGNDITFSNDLEKLGSQILGNKFKGVFASDKIPKLDKLKPYAILNLDNSRQPGSHWIAIAHLNDSSAMIYDSFGRKSEKIIPAALNVYNKVVDTQYDAEQHKSEDNCGQRSLAWLFLFDQYGPRSAWKV